MNRARFQMNEALTWMNEALTHMHEALTQIVDPLVRRTRSGGASSVYLARCQVSPARRDVPRGR
jgi:hypothetical protein